MMAGQIIARGAGTWLVRVFTGRSPDGKRKYINKTIHGTKKEAQNWLNKALRDHDLGIAVKPANDSLHQFLESWLESVAKKKLRPKTFAGYREALQRYVLPVLSGRPLAKISPLEIQSLYNAMHERGLSARTIQYTNMILKQALAKAVEWRMLTFKPCQGVTLPRQQRKEMQALAPEQTARFIAAAKPDRYGVLFELAISTGMRPSEYSALKWSDLNLLTGQLSVSRSLDFLPGGGWEISDNKTAGSRRTIKLWASVTQSIREHRTRQSAEREAAGESWVDHDFVFTNEVGGPVNRNNLTKRNFRRVLKAAGLPEIRLYDLRHTAATTALAAGVPVKVVSEMLGHASVAITLDIYSHVLPHMQDEAAQKMESLVFGAPPIPAEKSGKRHTIGTQRPN